MIAVFLGLATPAQAQVVVPKEFQVFVQVDLENVSPAHGDDFFMYPDGTHKARWTEVALCADAACNTWISTCSRRWWPPCRTTGTPTTMG